LGSQGQITLVVQPATAVIVDIQGGPAVTPTINAAPGTGHVVINYVGTLVSSTNVAGPYMLVPDATTPYTAPATNTQQFYRSKAN
jgi:hypothetical protein